MSQLRRHSAYEAAANIAAGVFLQYVLGFALIRWSGFQITLRQNLFITAVMTVASFARQYGIRRLFARWGR